MSNLLYTITAYDQTLVSSSPNVEGVGITTQYNPQSNAYEETAIGQVISTSRNIGRDANGNALGGGGIFDRVDNSGANPYFGTETDSYFGLILVNTATNDLGTIEGLISPTGGPIEHPWDGGPTPTLTYHHPSQTSNVHTLIVPTDNVVYQAGAARLGNVLVWHIPFGQLGIYGQNANLGFLASPVTAAMSDTAASAMILGAGYGLISYGADSSSFFNQDWP
jgi:hypothetical protein|tara:strand:- start:55 stop:720 length:666 start_codon:yes stop_codon:yes gene_type:complete